MEANPELGTSSSFMDPRNTDINATAERIASLHAGRRASGGGPGPPRWRAVPIRRTHCPNLLLLLRSVADLALASSSRPVQLGSNFLAISQQWVRTSSCRDRIDSRVGAFLGRAICSDRHLALLSHYRRWNVLPGRACSDRDLQRHLVTIGRESDSAATYSRLDWGGGSLGSNHRSVAVIRTANGTLLAQSPSSWRTSC